MIFFADFCHLASENGQTFTVLSENSRQSECFFVVVFCYDDDDVDDDRISVTRIYF